MNVPESYVDFHSSIDLTRQVVPFEKEMSSDDEELIMNVVVPLDLCASSTTSMGDEGKTVWQNEHTVYSFEMRYYLIFEQIVCIYDFGKIV